MEHNEILGMDAALKYINQTLVDKLGDITLQARCLLGVLYIVSDFHTKHSIKIVHNINNVLYKL